MILVILVIDQFFMIRSSVSCIFLPGGAKFLAVFQLSSILLALARVKLDVMPPISNLGIGFKEVQRTYM
jgi:hypothetical protein